MSKFNRTIEQITKDAIRDSLDEIAAAMTKRFGEATEGMEAGWLIEMARNDAPMSRWWHPMKGWVYDANEAIRFARKQDAEEFSKSGLHGAGGDATEHLFGRASPST